MATLLLGCVGALLIPSLASLILSRRPIAVPASYGAAAILAAFALVAGRIHCSRKAAA